MLPSHRDSPATHRGDHDWQHSLTLYLVILALALLMNVNFGDEIIR
jgi:hypothetical protein